MKNETKKAILMILFGVLVFSSNFVFAAKIYGDIYNIDLQPTLALVKINSTPEQKGIFYGNYSFNVPLGEYLLEAFYREKGVVYSDSELLSIKQEGSFRVDLILMETEEDIFLNDTELNSIIELLDMIQPEKKTKKTLLIILIIGILVVVAALVLLLVKKIRKKEQKPKRKKRKLLKEEKKPEEKIIELLKTDTFKKQAIDILQKERRILQKDLRKKLNVGEAKLSLLVSELEAEGKIKKIKRGRSNILVWQEI